MLEETTRLPAKPRFFRSPIKHIFGWELYSWHSWFITLNFKHLEFQLNYWPPNVNEEN